MRVLLLPSFYSYPGHEETGSFFRDQAKALSRAGVAARVAFVEPRSIRSLSLQAVAESRWQTIEANEHGVLTTRQKGWNTGLRWVWGSRVWALLLSQLVLQNAGGHPRPDIIHAHNALYAGLAARRIARRLGIPYLVTEHASAFLMGPLRSAEAEVARKVYADAHAIVSVSRALARAMAPYVGGKNIAILPNVVDSEFFVPPPIRRRCSTFRVLAVGYLNPNKGFDVLIRAFAAQFRGQRECELVIGGDGPEQMNLEMLAGQSGVSRQVRFLGRLTRQQVRDAMWGANVLTISSFHETFGVVALEAMSTGLPVIASRSGGPEDFVSAENGWLVPPGDVSLLAEALRLSWESRNDMRDVRRFISPYSMPSIAARLISLYEESTHMTSE